VAGAVPASGAASGCSEIAVGATFQSTPRRYQRRDDAEPRFAPRARTRQRLRYRDRTKRLEGVGNGARPGDTGARPQRCVRSEDRTPKGSMKGRRSSSKPSASASVPDDMSAGRKPSSRDATKRTCRGRRMGDPHEHELLLVVQQALEHPRHAQHPVHWPVCKAAGRDPPSCDLAPPARPIRSTRDSSRRRRAAEQGAVGAGARGCPRSATSSARPPCNLRARRLPRRARRRSDGLARRPTGGR